MKSGTNCAASCKRHATSWQSCWYYKRPRLPMSHRRLTCDLSTVPAQSATSRCPTVKRLSSRSSRKTQRLLLRSFPAKGLMVCWIIVCHILSIAGFLHVSVFFFFIYPPGEAEESNNDGIELLVYKPLDPIEAVNAEVDANCIQLGSTVNDNQVRVDVMLWRIRTQL